MLAGPTRLETDSGLKATLKKQADGVATQTQPTIQTDGVALQATIKLEADRVALQAMIKPEANGVASQAAPKWECEEDVLQATGEVSSVHSALTPDSGKDFTVCMPAQLTMLLCPLASQKALLPPLTSPWLLH